MRAMRLAAVFVLVVMLTPSGLHGGEGDETAGVQEEVGYFSYDADRSLLVLRQFLSEDPVNTYTLQDSGHDAMVFVSEATESAGGMRARLTFRFSGRDRYDLALDLAHPGEDYRTCQLLTMRRATIAVEEDVSD